MHITMRKRSINFLKIISNISYDFYKWKYLKTYIIHINNTFESSEYYKYFYLEIKIKNSIKTLENWYRVLVVDNIYNLLNIIVADSLPYKIPRMIRSLYILSIHRCWGHLRSLFLSSIYLQLVSSFTSRLHHICPTHFILLIIIKFIITIAVI